uniref:Uncharacterized protein n=1 Tax=Anopheles darlingi TaxID=43151 RepID=A0A2M4D2H7_ANODA
MVRFFSFSHASIIAVLTPCVQLVVAPGMHHHLFYLVALLADDCIGIFTDGGIVGERMLLLPMVLVIATLADRLVVGSGRLLCLLVQAC